MKRNFAYILRNISITYQQFRYLFFVVLAITAFSCSSTRFVPDGSQLLKSNSVSSDDKVFDASQLAPYMRQNPNSRWFSMFNVPLSIYSLSGSDSTKWANRVLRRLGEAPVVYDSMAMLNTCRDMETAMHSFGYLRAAVRSEAKTRGKKCYVSYRVFPGHRYMLDSVRYEVEDDSIRVLFDRGMLGNKGLRRGMVFSSTNLDNERKRISNILADSGYYKFNKDFIHYEADSVGKPGCVDLVLRLIKYRASNNSPEINHVKYYINDIRYHSNDGGSIPIRRKVLANNTAMKSGEPFGASRLQNTYNNFSQLQAVRFTSIRFDELPDTSLLNCNVFVSTRKPNTISFQPEGTNTAGDFGAAASLTYSNNNIFRGSELLSVQLRGAYEAITGLEGYQNKNYNEYNFETKLMFPRIIAPFVSHRLAHIGSMRSELSFSYNLQNRPEFHRRVLSSTWRYYWKSPSGRHSYRFDFMDINYVHMPWISSTFKQEYLDDVSNRNSILRYNYEDLFILKTGLNFSYTNGTYAIRSNFELGGNLLNGISHIFNLKKNVDNQYTLFNIAYAQYVKGDVDYTHLVRFDSKNTLALHCGLGLAYPYGNSKVLPFEKRYFSGGANSVRGWNVRELGPGKFKGTDGRIDFINQTGDMKLDVNMELRTYLFWKFNGAIFVDAGNIWTLKDYKDQPGGQFKIDEFYKQIAVAYGLGIRLNFDYFVMRFDLGFKAVNPAYTNKSEHYPIANPRFGRDSSFHFAVGMPF